MDAKNLETEGCCGGSCHNSEQKEAAGSPTVEELTDLLKRTQANFENYRKQMQSYSEEIKKMAARDVVLQLLPVLDNFELALKTVAKKEAAKDLVSGMELIYSQLMKVLQDNQVVQLDTQGQDFDPYYHEALMKIPADWGVVTREEDIDRILYGRGKRAK